MIGYLSISNSRCYSSNYLSHHSTLSESIDYCNSHSYCKWIQIRKSDQKYATYAVTSQMGNINHDSWVIANLNN